MTVNRVSDELLEEVRRRIVEAIRSEKIILFGSHAWGRPEEGSDIDLFVVVPPSDQPSYRQARDIYRSLRGIGVPVDVVIQSRDEVERGKKVATSLAKRVLEHGKVLYG